MNPLKRCTGSNLVDTGWAAVHVVVLLFTKAAENTGTLHRPIACWYCKGSGYDHDEAGLCRGCHDKGSKLDDVHHLAANSHAQAMISACWTLGGLPRSRGSVCGRARTCSASGVTSPLRAGVTRRPSVVGSE